MMPGGASQASRIMGLGRNRKKERPVSEQTRRKRTRLQTVRADVWSWHENEKEVRSSVRWSLECCRCRCLVSLALVLGEV